MIESNFLYGSVHKLRNQLLLNSAPTPGNIINIIVCYIQLIKGGLFPQRPPDPPLPLTLQDYVNNMYVIM